MTEPISLAEAKKAKGKAARETRRISVDDDDPVTVEVRSLNATHAFVLMGGAAWILRDSVDWNGRPAIEFLSIGAFRQFFETSRYWDGETDRPDGLGSLWMKHPLRRTYAGVTMAPEGAREGWFNLWRGWAVKPAEPYPDYRQHAKHFPTFYDHILRNAAHGNKRDARWIWAWFSAMVKNPVKKCGTAIVFRGNKGSGKTKIGEVFGSLFGPHHVVIDQPKHLTGGFNGHMANALLLQAEEGFWAGDPEAESRLKSLITSQVQLIEKKGVDATPLRNLVRLIVTSNSDWVVPASFDERRFAVFDVGNDNRVDFKFFQAIDDEMDSGGREHLLAYLLAFDPGDVDVREIPSTAGLYEQKISSMSELEAWWMDRLRDGRLLPQHGDWKREVGGDALFRCFRAYAELLRSRSRLPTKEQFGMKLKKLMPEKGFANGQKVWVDEYGPDGEVMHNADGSVSKRRRTGYHVPTLEDCRAHFEALLGWPVVWEPPSAPGDGGGEGAGQIRADDPPLPGDRHDPFDLIDDL